MRNLASAGGLRLAVAVAALLVAATGPAGAAGAAETARATAAARAAPAAGAVRPAQPVQPADVGGMALASHGIVVNYPAAGALPLPKVPASAYVIANAGTGAVLAAKDAHGLFPPASTLKVLTAITMLPLLKPGQLVRASKLAASAQPNIVGLTPGREYTVSDLFHALLLISANDAAVALVQASGSYAKGLALMNAQAHHLQAYDVVAKTPNGLPAAGQVVSAYDLALIARQALASPAFMHYDSALTARFPYKRHKSETLVNQNYLLTQYRGGIGGKIGWTVKAGATYVGLARRNGVTLIVTILHAPSLTEIHSAEKLLNWGFAMNGRVSPVGVLVPPLGAAKAGHGASKSDRQAGPLAASAGSRGPEAAAGIAAGAAIAVLGCLAWFRRRGLRGRRSSA